MEHGSHIGQQPTTSDALQERQRDAFEAAAIKEVLARQLAAAMKAQNLSRKRLAERMKTSRSQIRRLLDPGRQRDDRNAAAGGEGRRADAAN